MGLMQCECPRCSAMVAQRAHVAQQAQEEAASQARPFALSSMAAGSKTEEAAYDKWVGHSTSPPRQFLLAEVLSVLHVLKGQMADFRAKEALDVAIRTFRGLE